MHKKFLITPSLCEHLYMLIIIIVLLFTYIHLLNQNSNDHDKKWTKAYKTAQILDTWRSSSNLTYLVNVSLSFIVYLQVSSPCSKRLTFLLICEMIVIYFLRDLTAHMKTSGLCFPLAPTFYVNFYFWILSEKF